MSKDFAIIETGGKQYKVSPHQKIKIEKIEGKKGEIIKFRKVLLLNKEDKIEIGKPFISKAVVEGKILSQGKNKKVLVLKYKPKTRYKVKTGHRQPYTEVEIMKI